MSKKHVSFFLLSAFILTIVTINTTIEMTNHRRGKAFCEENNLKITNKKIKNEKKQLRDSIDFLRKDIEENKNLLKNIEDNTLRLNNEISLNNEEFLILKEKIEKNQSEIEIKQKEKDEVFCKLKQILVLIEKSGSTDVFDLFLSSKDFSDLFKKIEATSDISKTTIQLINDLEKSTNEIKHKKQVNESSFEKLNQKQECLRKELNNLEEEKIKVQKKIDEFVKNLDEKKNVIMNYNKKVIENKPVYSLPFIENTPKNISPNNNFNIVNKAKVLRNEFSANNNNNIWPVPYSHAVSQKFSNYHKAVDIPAPCGEPILSINSGTVIEVNSTNPCGSGWGYFVVIKHANGLISRYAHASKIFVSVGQVVDAGEPIAFIGSTGNSTGPHLHLEITKDGFHIDPLSIL
ncbi:MAG: peptidoglycan DD-metalloendopeptidase family protein [Oscillospiraceae bacterium]|nr:peptidoglycan DD-metalloendopeptidase family protein [Oscillospiraceae bacterium]